MDKPSELDSGSKLDRHFSPNICFDRLRREGEGTCDPEEEAEMSLAPVIQTLPVQSIICDWNNEGNEAVRVKGVAWAGGGKGIARVDVSGDGGDTFKGSRIISPIDPTWNRNWSWIHFEARIELDYEQKRALQRGESVKMELVSKAVDDNFNAQPENMEPNYNVLGVCINHWKRVPITIEPMGN